MFGTARNRWWGGIALVAAIGVALGLAFADDQDADAHANGNDDAPAPTINVGVFNPQIVVEGYHRRQELMDLAEELQAEFEAAMQANDQQKMMEIQRRFQQREQEVMESLMAKIEQVFPVIAEEEKLDLIVLEIQYQTTKVAEPKDITEKLLTRVNEKADQPDEQPTEPPAETGR
jgi:hypothetical protein